MLRQTQALLVLLLLVACDESPATSASEAGALPRDAGFSCIPGSVRIGVCENDGGVGLEVCRDDGQAFEGPVLGCAAPEVSDAGTGLTSCTGLTASDRGKACSFGSDKTCAVESERCCCQDSFDNRLCEMDQLVCTGGVLRLSGHGEAVCSADAGCPAPLEGIVKEKRAGFDLGQAPHEDKKVIAYWNFSNATSTLRSTELDGTVSLEAPCAATPAVKPYSAFTWSAPADGRYRFTVRPLWSQAQPSRLFVDYVLHLRRGFSGAYPREEECSDGAKTTAWPSVEAEARRGARLVLVVSAWMDSLIEHAIAGGGDNPVAFELQVHQQVACDLSKPETPCKNCGPGAALCGGLCLVVNDPKQCGCKATACAANEHCVASVEAAGGYRCKLLDANPNALDCDGDGVYEAELKANSCGCKATGGIQFCSWYVPTCRKTSTNSAVCSPLRCEVGDDGCVSVNAGTTSGL